MVVPNAVGTLENALSGSGVTSVVVNVASRVSFHTFNDIVTRIGRNERRSATIISNPY